MAFYVDKQKTLRNTLRDLLTEKFGDKVSFKEDGWTLYVQFKDAGVPDEHHYLTQEQIAAGLFGGGLIEGLDEQSFKISIEGLK